jgi:prolyl-tRNA synthetase
LKFTQTLIPTLKEDPAEAEVVSHKLMLRAGFIRKLAAGIYAYLPLGLRVIQKVEKIIREEMTAAGAQELLLPVVMPAELWNETGRWDYYGKELLRFKDRSDRDFCIGPTHEEAITDLARREIKSYRDLPKNLFQIQTKFRDEIRPRFGLMRGREFIMKDAYSFDVDEEASHVSYQAMYDAYGKIFKRCGLDFRPVEAATGAIGGTLSHEFQVLAESGEDPIFFCNKCDYAASIERARTMSDKDLAELNKSNTGAKPNGKHKEVSTPKMKTVEDVSAFLKIKPSELIKTILYTVSKDDKIFHVAAMVRGSEDVVEPKLVKALFDSGITPSMDVNIDLADEKVVRELTGAAVGFAGPVSLPDSVTVVADSGIYGDDLFVTGANKNDTHLTGVSWQDCNIKSFVDIRCAKKGDHCVLTGCKGGRLDERRGIEVGQVFYLGTKYSEKMKATYLDPNGKEKLIIMGCYGIGVGRTAAAAIEQNNDECGMVWPITIAPFHCHLIALYGKDERIREFASEVYCKLQESGIEVLYDDRDARAGVKFADADLIGVPYQVIIGARSLEEGKLEIKERQTGTKSSLLPEELIEKIKGELINGCA